MLVPGRSVTVSAPLSGTEQDLLSVQQEVSLRKVEFDLAQAKVKRARQLLDDKAGSARELEEAEAQLASAMVTLKSAQARLELLSKGELDVAGNGLSSLIIKSPLDGIIQEVLVSPGQTVTGTMALVKITGMDPIWVKVPVYVGDLAAINTEQPARVHSLADFAGVKIRTAKPVVAPFTADSESVTAALFYELSNTDLSYWPGQKVSVTLTLRNTEQSLVVPYSAIVYDMYGSAWVYQNTQPRVYVRRRVELRYVLDELAILSRGLDVGAKVVTAGAAELFGTEFGVGK